MNQPSGETLWGSTRFADLAQRARGAVAEAVKSFSRGLRECGKPSREAGQSVERAKTEALRRARRGGGKTAEEGEKSAASPSERLLRWRRDFFRHARRFGWASELLQSEEWRKAGRALAEERLRDSAIHLAQAGLRVGSQGLGTVIGGMIGAETGPGAALAAWAGGTFLGALGDRAASVLDRHHSEGGRRASGRAKGRER